MKAYTSFAEAYDIFMDNVPYEEWADYLQEILRQYEITDGLVLELGCGTGNMSQCLAARGYDMIGLDQSTEMLQVAAGKKESSGYDILYLQQDMTEFELYGTVRAVISVCDCINYILETEALVEVFRLVNNYLDPGGVFLFDFNTVYKYRDILGDQTIAEVRDEASFIWDNYFDEETGTNEYELTLFLKEEGKSCLYRRYQELHIQRAYTLEEIQEALKASGLLFLGAYDAYTTDQPQDNSERISVIAGEQGK